MQSKINVLYTISNFDTAGSGKVIYDLVNNLDKEIFHVEIACGSGKGPYFQKIKSLGVTIHIIPTKTHYRPYLTLLTRVLQISNFFRKGKYQIVHSWQWSSDWTEALAARMAGIKYVYTKKSMGHKSKHWKIKSWLASFIITVNTDMGDFFPYKRNQKLIPFGLDTSYYAPLSMNPIPSNSFKISTVANLVPIKGIEVLIEAVSLIDNDNIELSIVGDATTSYAQSLKKLSTTLGIEDRVIFTGKLLDIRPVLGQTDLYVIPTHSKGEGMPMALVEAMSLGKICLGSDVPGINYVLRDFKELLFPAANSKALYKKILEIMAMTDDRQREIGLALREYCLTNFTMSQFISKHESLYLEIAK